MTDVDNHEKVQDEIDSDADLFTMGSDVACTDGAGGKLRRVVIDPVDRSLTHLVVETKHHGRPGRLVPIAVVTSSGPDVHLSCTLAELDAFEAAEETRFLPGATGQWAYGQDQMLSHPYYSLGMTGGLGLGMGTGVGASGPRAITTDKVPADEVEVRRGEHVYATDGPVGKVRGLVIDPSDHHVTHVLLDEGHLWGKKRVAIPIASVSSVAAGVQLELTKDEVGDLPPVGLADDQ